MKKFICSFFVLLFLPCILFPQWSTDANINLIVGYGQDPKICSDSAGGCYITYAYGTLSYPQKLAVERLDKYGYKPWGTLKQILGELPEQWQAEIIEDGEGGVIVSYQDNEENWPYSTTRVRVQKVDSAGNFLWGQTGIRVSLETTNHSGQQLVSDGDGGCVIVWADWNDEISVNRIDRFGERVWGDSGIVLPSTGTSLIIIRASDGNYYIKISTNMYRINQNGHIVNQYSSILGQPVPDPDGGVVLGYRVWTGQIPRLVAQRKDSLGNNLWQEPYVEIADSLFINSQLNIRYNYNYYFGWTSNKNGIETQPHIQGLRDDGTVLFINGGIPLSNSSTTITSFIPIIPSDNMSNIYIWNQWINQPSSTGNFALRIDTTATQIWEDSAVLLNIPALRYLGVTTDCSGGAIGTGYLNEDFAIRVFKISAHGKLGEVITSVENNIQGILPILSFLYQNHPNPFNSSTTIKYDLPNNSDVSLIIYDILGRNVKELVNTKQQAGRYEVQFNASNLASGVYIYQLIAEKFISSKKMILLK
jgi:hypothetical protein